MPGFLRPETTKAYPKQSASRPTFRRSSVSEFRRPFAPDGQWSPRSPSNTFPENTHRGDLTVEDIVFFHVLSPESDLFGDGHHSFYTLYRNIFALIAQNEPARFSVPFPTFGSSVTRWTLGRGARNATDGSAKAFYEFWTNFQTSRDFSDVINRETTAAGTRSACKRVKAKNRKVLQQASTEYNEAVRSLVTSAGMPLVNVWHATFIICEHK
ncbi:hypothetical protein AcW1_001545 [Taiwanofungus camphoratus]|nr:hypothetical protein AcW1_001545 [Antrodia cinnamomea]